MVQLIYYGYDCYCHGCGCHCCCCCYGCYDCSCSASCCGCGCCGLCICCCYVGAASVRLTVVAAVFPLWVLPLLFLVRRPHCEDEPICHRDLQLDRFLLSFGDLVVADQFSVSLVLRLLLLLRLSRVLYLMLLRLLWLMRLLRSHHCSRCK